MAKRTPLQKIETKLRLLTANVFLTAMHKDSFRESVTSNCSWSPGTPVVPTIWSTPIGDVRKAVTRHSENGVNLIMVPVLLRDPLRLGVLHMQRGSSGSFWSENILNIDSDMDMGTVYETLNPNKKWAIDDLYDENQEDRDSMNKDLDRLLDMT